MVIYELNFPVRSPVRCPVRENGRISRTGKPTGKFPGEWQKYRDGIRPSNGSQKSPVKSPGQISPWPKRGNNTFPKKCGIVTECEPNAVT